MKVLYVVIGLAMAALQLTLVRWMARKGTPRAQLLCMAGKLLLWVLFFLLLVWVGREALLWAAIPALVLYAAGSIFWMLGKAAKGGRK